MAGATKPRAVGTGVPAGRSVSTAESELIARGIASAVAPEGGLEPAQVSLLGAIADALLDIDVDFAELDPLEADELAEVLSGRGPEYRTRIVHHMVLGELILRPIPADVARRVATYAEALEVDDQFVRVARRYAQGAFGLAWLDLHRSGFAEHWEMARTDQLETSVKLADQPRPEWRIQTWSNVGRPSGTYRRGRSGGAYGRCIGVAASLFPDRSAVRRPISRSTTSSTCSPTTEPTSRASSRSSL